MQKLILLIFGLGLWVNASMAEVIYHQQPMEGELRVLRTYYENGKEIAKRGFNAAGELVLSENEIPDGPVKAYYENGQIAVQGNYFNGKLSGEFKEFYDSGMLLSQRNYFFGMVEGQAQRYYDDGTVMSVETFAQNKREGEGLYYSQQGELVEKRFYNRDVCTGKEQVQRRSAMPVNTLQQEDATQNPEMIDKPYNLFSSSWPASNMQGTVMFSGNWVYAAYAMTNVNEIIDAWSDYLDFYGRGTVDKISDGTSMGLEVSWWASDDVILGIGFEGMGNKTEGGDETLGVIYDLNALEFEGTIKWSQKMGNHFLSVGAGLCYLELIHSTQYQYGSAAGYLDGYRTFTGSTVGYKVMFSYDIKWSDYFGIGLTTGYRVAEIKSVRYTAAGYIDEKFETLDGANASIDFSGFFFKGGLRFYL